MNNKYRVTWFDTQSNFHAETVNTLQEADNMWLELRKVVPEDDLHIYEISSDGSRAGLVSQ